MEDLNKKVQVFNKLVEVADELKRYGCTVTLEVNPNKDIGKKAEKILKDAWFKSEISVSLVEPKQ